MAALWAETQTHVLSEWRSRVVMLTQASRKLEPGVSSPAKNPKSQLGQQKFCCSSRGHSRGAPSTWIGHPAQGSPKISQLESPWPSCCKLEASAFGSISGTSAHLHQSITPGALVWGRGIVQGSPLDAGCPPTFALSPASWASAWTQESLERCSGDSEVPPCWAAPSLVCAKR